MKSLRLIGLPAVVATILLIGGCAASRSPTSGAFGDPSVPLSPAPPVTVAFVFTHTHRSIGRDVVPKLHHPDRYANGFYDFFREALPELRNIRTYATFTDRAEDVTSPQRRAERDSLATGSHDFTVSMRFMQETSFVRDAAGVLASSLTLTAAPVPYPRRYLLAVDVTDRSGRLVRRYERSATVTRWVQVLLIFAYPFHPEQRKTEEVYLEFLRDVFREIEADQVLSGVSDPQGTRAPESGNGGRPLPESVVVGLAVAP